MYPKKSEINSESAYFKLGDGKQINAFDKR